MSLEIRLCEPDFISPVPSRPRQVPLPPKSMPRTQARFSPPRIRRPHDARFSSESGDGREARPGWALSLRKKSDKIIKIQNCMYFSKNKKIRKKVLTFAFDGGIITKLSARADAKEF